MSSIDTPAGPSTKSETEAIEGQRLVIAGVRLPRTGTIVLLLVALALALRLWELGARPFHHDESLDAWWSWRFRNGQYTEYDPVYHGPLRFYITAGFYEIFGESDAVARLFSALTGTAVVGLPWFLRRELGRPGTIAAAVALTISPTMLYYSRFGREDAQMVFLTLLAMVLGLSYLRTPRISTATALAFTLSCSFAIKESTYLFGLLLAVFLLIILAAQFDAQNRVALGIESDVNKLNPAFISASLLLASAGLTVIAVVGHLSGELFPLVALYMAGLGTFVLATALPRLRQATIRWSLEQAGLCVIAGTVAAACLVLIRRGTLTDAVTPWIIVPGLWVVAAGAIALAAVNRPRATSVDHEWPALVRSIGAIGFVGWAIALGVFAVSWFLFFTVWGEVPGDWASGFTRAIEYWDSQQEVNRGGQPWYYYFYALPIYEWLFVLLAFVGAWRGLRRPTMMSVLMVWFAVGSMILYSYAGERMPWLIAHPLLPMLILAAMGVQQLWQYRDRAAMPAVATVLGLALLFTTATSIRASFPNGADSREMLSQAGQATPHVIAALERLDTLDEISMRETGQPAQLSIGTTNAWPYSWYLRDRVGLSWFDGCTGPPTDGSADVIIVDRTLNCDTNTPVGRSIDPAGEFPDYQSTLFAMRSWWVPTYTDAGPLGWVRYAVGRELWEQGPNPGFVGVGEIAAEGDGGLGATLERLKEGADISAFSWIGFTGADGDLVPDPPIPGAFTEPDDGLDGCGSVDQYFLVHNRFAFSEAVVNPAPIDAMGTLPCVSDQLASPR